MRQQILNITKNGIKYPNNSDLNVGIHTFEYYWTIAHDLLDHQHGIEEIGKYEDELEATGARWYSTFENTWDMMPNSTYTKTNFAWAIQNKSKTLQTFLNCIIVIIEYEDILRQKFEIKKKANKNYFKFLEPLLIKRLEKHDSGMIRNYAKDITNEVLLSMTIGYEKAKKKYNNIDRLRKIYKTIMDQSYVCLYPIFKFDKELNSQYIDKKILLEYKIKTGFAEMNIQN